MFFHFRVVRLLRKYTNNLLNHVSKDVIRIGIEDAKRMFSVEESAVLLLTAWLDSGVPESALTPKGRQAVMDYREMMGAAEAEFGNQS